MDDIPLRPDCLRALLVHAGRCVRACVTGDDVASSPCPDPALLEARGVFVTLRRGHELAGCIGFVRAPQSVWEAVARAAQASAREDPRFDAVRVEDLDSLEVEVSVLTTPVTMTAESFEPGRHGLILRARGQQGLLLPQVSTEHALDRNGFLAALCQKAAVPMGSWEEPGAELLGFEVQVVQARLRDLPRTSPE
jgi:AmmeMemoRadiSam system protein A